MRYKETGQIHLDFHGAVNTTVEYISGKYGAEALHEIFFATGRDVYKDIREHLRKGDSSELLKYWKYFFDREKGDYEIKEENGNIVFHVKTCPAVRHVKKLGLKVSPEFCSQTVYVNKGITDGTPYEIETVKTGECSCVQTLRRRKS